MRHELKTDPDAFDAVWEGCKTHEIRFNDRKFAVGDVLELHRTLHTGDEMRLGAPLVYTGKVMQRTVTHIQRGYGLAPNWVILSLGMPEL